ncbi:hypothetical protein GCM10010517_81260 [Streptosporangium fragile]|uniref:Uncharacterized protein n=1 Tax=Streptosporangium fragile TaxID=46186 RepID=A0ABN3WHV0_9ACTN
MIPVQETPEFSAKERICPEASHLVAGMHGKALAMLQRLLKSYGFRTVLTHRIGIRLRGDRLSQPKASITHHAPDLTVYDDGGRMAATVTVGRRAGQYLVSLPMVDVGCLVVNVDQPHEAADMINAVSEEAA